jgi:tetratricopeptide (TPR) repeat protein
MEDVYFKEAMDLFEDGRYEDALIKFIILTEKIPNKAEFWDWRARCHLKLREYKEALSSSDIAITLEPFVEEYYKTRGRAYYALGKYSKSAEDFKTYLSKYPRDASIYVMLGLSYFKLDRFKEAEKSFRKAKELSPALRNVVDYHLGYIAIQTGRKDEGINLLRDVMQRTQGTPLADEIRSQIDSIEQALKRTDKLPGKWYASISAGIEYSNNVLSLSKDTLLPSDISQKHDTSLFLVGQGGYNIYTNDRSQLWFSGLVYGNIYFELDDFDVQQYQPGIQYLYNPSEKWQLSSSLFYTSYRVDGDRSSDSFSFSQGATYLMSRNTSTTLNYTGTINEFAGDTLAEEDRDGNYHTLELYQLVGFDYLKALLVAGFRYGWNNTDGKEFDSDFWSVFTTLSHNFVYGSRLMWNVSYARMDFDNPSSRAVPAYSYHRRDKTYTGSITWLKYIRKDIATSLGLTYLDNDSNITVYEYDKYTLTLSFTYRFN